MGKSKNGGNSAQPAHVSTGNLNLAQGNSKSKKKSAAAQGGSCCAEKKLPWLLGQRVTLWHQHDGAASASESGGEGTTPADKPPASAAQARSKEAAVSKLHKKVAELESRLSKKEAKVTGDLRTSLMWFFLLNFLKF